MYPFSKIEKKWRKRWLDMKLYEPDLDSSRPNGQGKAKKTFYNLMMFPYPSAEGLHIGSVRTFTGVDVYGRYMRMRGHDVFEPIGLDGFGIHSENYALKVGKHPTEHAKTSEKNFYRQLGYIGNGFAWDERLETYDPDYYKWTQWIFIQMWKHGLAYRKKTNVNWCPSCKTVLADEQVLQGECERCGTTVTKKELEQWFFKITKYADRLLKNLENIDWSEHIKTAQKNWIGRSEEALLKFEIRPPTASRRRGRGNSKFEIPVFTTRPDTIFGATYMVLAPEHKLVGKLEDKITNWKEVEAYVKKAKSKTENERIAEAKTKTGVPLKGVAAVNPATKKEIPVWVADYVLASYGTGAIMAVPAHDQRDYDFAKKYGLDTQVVIEPETGEPLEDAEFRESIVAIVENPKTKKYLSLNWGRDLGGSLFIGGGVESGESPEQTAIREIREETGYKNVEYIDQSEKMHHHYFAFSKGVARKIEVVGLHFKLVNGEKDEVSLQKDEQGNFKVEWLTDKEVLEKFEDKSHIEAFRRLVLGEVYTGNGIMANSGRFDGMDSEEAKWKITKEVGGKKETHYHLRDWLISRQRYWGPPIPMIYCPACAEDSAGRENAGWQAVPEKDLPVLLPKVKNFRPEGTGKAPLASVKSFYETKCPKCKSPARRETDVSDTFLDSAWYYIGYLARTENSPALGKPKAGPGKLEILNSKFRARARKWLPVDSYIGGAEHAVLHLLYARFLTMAFKDMGLLDFEEPFTKFRTHGLITLGGVKMSKSKGNVIDPDDYVGKFGVDAIRVYLQFIAPLSQGGMWQDSGLLGAVRFLDRVWKLGAPSTRRTSSSGVKFVEGKSISPWMHKSIKKVTDDIPELKYNTAISELMIALNRFEEEENVNRRDFETFLLLLAPFAPFITEELWQTLARTDAEDTPSNGASADRRGKSQRSSASSRRESAFRSIHKEPWPEYDKKYLVEDTINLVVQVNGKVRATVEVDKGISQKEAEKLALAEEGVTRHLKGKPKKVIFVKDKLINFVA